jgi:hypothetical protein
MARIILSKSFGGFRARFEDEHHVYASGRTSDEAIGNLVTTFRNRLNLEIVCESKKEDQHFSIKNLLTKTTP